MGWRVHAYTICYGKDDPAPKKYPRIIEPPRIISSKLRNISMNSFSRKGITTINTTKKEDTTGKSDSHNLATRPIYP